MEDGFLLNIQHSHAAKRQITVLCSSCELVRLMPGYKLVRGDSVEKVVRLGRTAASVAHLLAGKLPASSVRAIDVMPSRKQDSDTSIYLPHRKVGKLSYLVSDQNEFQDHRDSAICPVSSLPSDQVPSDMLSAFVADMTGVLVVDASLPAPILHRVIKAWPKDQLVFAVVASEDEAWHLKRSISRPNAIAMNFRQAAKLNGGGHSIEGTASTLAGRLSRQNSVLFISNGDKEAALATNGVLVTQAPPKHSVVHSPGAEHHMAAELFAGLITKDRTQTELLDSVLAVADDTSVKRPQKSYIELLTNDAGRNELCTPVPGNNRGSQQRKIEQSLIDMCEDKIEPKQALKSILTAVDGGRRSILRNIFIDWIAREFEPKHMFNLVLVIGIFCLATTGNSS